MSGERGCSKALGQSRLGGDWPTDWRVRRRYLPWRAVTRANGSIGKVPLDGRGLPVNPLDSSAWQEWPLAWAAVESGRAQGIGLAITPEIRLTAIDLDACLTADDALSSLAQSVLETFRGAYVERSPSGRGLHVLLRGACPPGWRRQRSLELIDRGYLTVTGERYGDMAVMRPDHTRDLQLWHAAHSPVDHQAPHVPRQPIRHPVGDWFHQACHARNGDKFKALWAGALAGCPTASEGDLQLVLLILYWWPDATDAELTEVLLGSGRLRPKLRSEPYLRRTLGVARRLQQR